MDGFHELGPAHDEQAFDVTLFGRSVVALLIAPENAVMGAAHGAGDVKVGFQLAQRVTLLKVGFTDVADVYRFVRSVTA